MLADCMNYKTGLPSYSNNFFDLAIVDPMYGSKSDAIGLRNDVKHLATRGDYEYIENKAPELLYFQELKRVSKNQIVWGCNFFNVPYFATGGRLVWNKKGTVFGEGEMAYNSQSKAVRFIKYTWNGMIQEDPKNKEKRIHAMQKPVGVYQHILRTWANPGDLILDTHTGSASSLIACESMGFNYHAFEILEPVFIKAKNRMSKGIQSYMFH